MLLWTDFWYSHPDSKYLLGFQFETSQSTVLKGWVWPVKAVTDICNRIKNYKKHAQTQLGQLGTERPDTMGKWWGGQAQLCSSQVVLNVGLKPKLSVDNDGRTIELQPSVGDAFDHPKANCVKKKKLQTQRRFKSYHLRQK